MALLYIISLVLFSFSLASVFFFADETNTTQFKKSIALLVVAIIVISGALYWDHHADAILYGDSTASKIYIYENAEYVIWEDDVTHEYYVLGHNSFDVARPVYRIYLDTETVKYIDEMYAIYEDSGAAFADMRSLLRGEEVQ